MRTEGAHILVVDDDRSARAFLADALASTGHLVRCVAGGRAAIAAIVREPLPDLMLVDLRMPQIDGLTLLARVRGDPATAGIPIIVVSGFSEVRYRLATFEAGANDYLTKPVDGAELRARVRSQLRTAAEMARLRRGALLDPLTGLLNRAGIDHLLGLHIQLAIRQGSPLAVLFADIDGFKRINDRFGHAAGDRALCSVADALRDQLRGSDFSGRWGGDEFVIGLPGAGGRTAAGVVARLERAVCEVRPAGDGTPGLRISVGVASLFHDVQLGAGGAVRRLVESADLAMYRARQAHRVAGFAAPRVVARGSGRMKMANQAPAGPDRRRSCRVRVDARAMVRIGEGSWSASRVGDLSLGGALLVDAPHLATGDPVNASIRVDGGPRLTVTGTVVRSGTTARGESFLGIRFGSTSAEGKDLIEDIVADATEHATGAPILLVDPEPSSRRTSAVALRAAGSRVVSAKTPLRALDVLESNDMAVTAVVVAIRLGQTSGLELARYVADAHPGIRRVLLTTEDGRPAASVALATGEVDAVVYAPWAADDLVAAARADTSARSSSPAGTGTRDPL